MSLNGKKYDFTCKVALITGSSSGIGAAIAIQLAQYGAKVTITGRIAANLEKVAKQIEQVSDGVKPLQIIGDLLNESQPKRLIDETIDKFGRLDILVNNAGGSTPNGTLASAKLLDEFDNLIKLNVRSVVELTQLAVPHLEKTKGNVINISSIGSIAPFVLVFCASKAALDMVTKTSALELGPKGIRVNSINLGPVATAAGRSMGLNDSSAIEKMLESIAPDSLLGQFGQPEDVANLASFLASDKARNITGSICVSDSGMLIKPVHYSREAVQERLQTNSM